MSWPAYTLVFFTPFFPASPALPCPILPCQVLPCPVLSYHVKSCSALSYPTMSSPACPALSYPTMSSPALPCPILPCQVLPCPVLSYHVKSCPALSYPTMSSPALPCPILPCQVLPCPVLSYHVKSCPACPVLSYHVKSCPALSYPTMSSPALPCPILPCQVLPCPVLSYPTLSHSTLYYRLFSLCPVLHVLLCSAPSKHRPAAPPALGYHTLYSVPSCPIGLPCPACSILSCLVPYHFLSCPTLPCPALPRPGRAYSFVLFVDRLLSHDMDMNVTCWHRPILDIETTLCPRHLPAITIPYYFPQVSPGGKSTEPVPV